MSKTVRRACHYCGRKFETLTVDHIVPKSRGGRNATWNRVPACRPCNQAKGNDWPFVYVCEVLIR